MTSFNYEAVNSSGGLTQGRVEARDLREAQRELRRRGLIPVVVETSSKVARGPKVRTRPLRDRDYILAIGEFATLVEAGVSLGEAVPALAERSDGGPLADAFAAARLRKL
jgi:type II secretory pathway component PulF